ncbi:hypothetical protein OH77DRAFT_1431986 [Trametes cingulata]|nr:hypothetical protein OH77DRAFT_1431986 [Trametes cingulata]
MGHCAPMPQSRSNKVYWESHGRRMRIYPLPADIYGDALRGHRNRPSRVNSPISRPSSRHFPLAKSRGSYRVGYGGTHATHSYYHPDAPTLPPDCPAPFQISAAEYLPSPSTNAVNGSPGSAGAPPSSSDAPPPPFYDLALPPPPTQSHTSGHSGQSHSFKYATPPYPSSAAPPRASSSSLDSHNAREPEVENCSLAPLQSQSETDGYGTLAPYQMHKYGARSGGNGYPAY